MDGITFYKMSGSGNDFVMLDGRLTTPVEWPAERVRAICDRRLGVGADGLVILTPDGADRVRMDFWNCDGSRADMCGNAALCSTRLATLLELAPADRMRLVTRAGTFLTRCRPEGSEAELNLPDFRLPTRPGDLEAQPGESGHVLATVGVPHLVLEVIDLESGDLMVRGRELRRHPSLGPAGANVNFVAPSPDASRWLLRTFERGVEGETLACGTGAVATAVALAQSGRARLPLDLVTRSGCVLHITATLSDDEAKDVWLRGEGRLVFTGLLRDLPGAL
ncbi:MAG: diaminopimelate epimerase [Gemmatimonadota bacterium]